MRIAVQGIRGVLDVITKIVVIQLGQGDPKAVSIGIQVHQAVGPINLLVPRSTCLGPRDEMPFPNGKQVLCVAEFIVFTHATKRRTRASFTDRN